MGEIRNINGQVIFTYSGELQDAHFQGANLRGAYLQGADLRWADFRGANLEEADLRGTNLEEADLRETCLANIKTCGDSRELAAYILFGAAGKEVLKRTLAKEILISKDWDLKDLLNADHPSRAWAVEVLCRVDGFDRKLKEYELSTG